MVPVVSWPFWPDRKGLTEIPVRPICPGQACGQWGQWSREGNLRDKDGVQIFMSCRGNLYSAAAKKKNKWYNVLVVTEVIPYALSLPFSDEQDGWLSPLPVRMTLTTSSSNTGSMATDSLDSNPTEFCQYPANLSMQKYQVVVTMLPVLYSSNLPHPKVSSSRRKTQILLENLFNHTLNPEEGLESYWPRSRKNLEAPIDAFANELSDSEMDYININTYSSVHY